MSEVPYRPIDRVRDIAATAGRHVTYAYEDMAFVEHNHFLLRMEERGDALTLFWNVESDPAERPGMEATLTAKAADLGITLTPGGFFRLEEADEANLNVVFLDR